MSQTFLPYSYHTYQPASQLPEKNLFIIPPQKNNNFPEDKGCGIARLFAASWGWRRENSVKLNHQGGHYVIKTHPKVDLL